MIKKKKRIFIFIYGALHSTHLKQRQSGLTCVSVYKAHPTTDLSLTVTFVVCVVRKKV